MQLTPTLLELRVESLRAQIERTGHGPADEEMLRRIRCDDCGFVYDLLDLTFPIGWTTEGDLINGFHDRCRACSQR